MISGRERETEVCVFFFLQFSFMLNIFCPLTQTAESTESSLRKLVLRNIPSNGKNILVVCWRIWRRFFFSVYIFVFSFSREKKKERERDISECERNREKESGTMSKLAVIYICIDNLYARSFSSLPPLFVAKIIGAMPKRFFFLRVCLELCRWNAVLLSLSWGAQNSEEILFLPFFRFCVYSIKSPC